MCIHKSVSLVRKYCQHVQQFLIDRISYPQYQIIYSLGVVRQRHRSADPPPDACSGWGEGKDTGKIFFLQVTHRK